MSRIVRAALPFLVLVALNVLYHLPHLLNAAGVHSDAAIVGLQAQHILRGEHSRFLWGAGYQGSFDAYLIALIFAVTGPSPLALMLAPFAGHLLLTFLVWHILSRRLSPWVAMLLCLPLVFTGQAINGVVLYAPRQWAVTLVFVGIWLLDGASGHRRKAPRLAAGVLVATLSLFLDLFTLQLVGPVAVFALLCCLDPPRWRILLRVLAVVAGLVLGYYAVAWLRRSPGASGGEVSLVFTLAQVKLNWPLYRDVCLPVLLGGKVYVGGVIWAPGLMSVVQIWGPWALILGTLAAVPLALIGRIPWGVRRLGLLGVGCAVASSLGFLLSGRPTDIWSTRYLAPVVWLAPFSLAPLASLVRARYLAPALLLPYALAAGVGGWLFYPEYIDGPWPRVTYPTPPRELAVAAFLRARGVKSAAAQYWLSYRLSFLFRERPEVMPLAEWEDRYSPYRGRFAAAPVVAYLFHPSEPRAVPGDVLPQLQAEGGEIEVTEIEGYTVIVYHRPRP